MTADEIRRADGVIVAADKKVEMARFNGKHVLQRPVSDGINKSGRIDHESNASGSADPECRRRYLRCK